VARISSDRFPHAAQNKRYLGDLVSNLIREAKDGKDLFEDVPLDTRHVKKKVKAQFPREWGLNMERVQELGRWRKSLLLNDEEKRNSREEGAQESVAGYVGRMPLGRGLDARERVREEETVRVR
jgi:hypothetical protein